MNAVKNKSDKSITPTENEWKKTLTKDQYQVLRQKGTEAPFTGALLHNKDTGNYTCAGCGTILFSSDTKFDSGSGWPSFYAAHKNAIQTKADFSLILPRVEVLCRKCGGHLGHVFDDGPAPSGKRFCINSAALEFKKIQSKK